ncbi:TonB-dependent receptor, partial [Campylobacter sp. MIT 19-121]|uniref:TonB-dependent receptor domain-containing protein n=1 Tax=Campylobacter sp. MIT 19-121 TaxID=2703906 RepID=UPI001389D10A
PGAYTQVDPSQGGVSVNIRGMTGLGRVNTMIDGVPQTFFGTSEEQGRYHGGGRVSGTSAFGAMVDQNLLVGVDIQRGTFSGANGGNALMGSANLRTIGVKDIVSKNNIFGVMAKYSYGTNSLGPSYMGAVAGKYDFDLGYVGLMYAYSGRKLSQGYKIGEDETTIVPPDPNDPNSSIYAFNPQSLTQKPVNQLAKLELAYKTHSSTLQYRRYDNNLAGRKLIGNNYQINYRYNPNDILDINLALARNEASQHYNENVKIMSTPVGNMKGITYNTATMFNLGNTIASNLSQNLDLSTTFGVNFMSNSYSKSLDWGQSESSNDGSTDMPGFFQYGFAPDGKQNIKTLYLDNAFSSNFWDFSLNLNYVFAELSTIRQGACQDFNAYCSPKEAGAFKKNFNNFNISSMLAAKIHTLFTPFVSYSRTYRIPNVQEMFFSGTFNTSSDNFQDLNTGLRPELANTYQIGFNSFTQGLLYEDDSFGFKAVYYYTHIKDYIYNQNVINSDNFGPPNYGENDFLLLPLNTKAIFSGIEAELRYDMGFFYTKLTYTHQNTDRQVSQSEANANGSQASHINLAQSQFSELPEDYAVLDLGTRLFNQKFILGSRATYTGKMKRIDPSAFMPDNNTRPPANTGWQELWAMGTQDLPSQPIILDLYASFEPFKNFIIKGEIQNLLDEKYIDALNSYNQTMNSTADPLAMNNYARGRTYVMSFSYKY